VADEGELMSYKFITEWICGQKDDRLALEQRFYEVGFRKHILALKSHRGNSERTLDPAAAQSIALLNLVFRYPLRTLQGRLLDAGFLAILVLLLREFPPQAAPPFPFHSIALILEKAPERAANNLRTLEKHGGFTIIFQYWGWWLETGINCGADHALTFVEDLSAICNALYKWQPKTYEKYTAKLVCEVLSLLQAWVNATTVGRKFTQYPAVSSLLLTLVMTTLRQRQSAEDLAVAGDFANVELKRMDHRLCPKRYQSVLHLFRLTVLSLRKR